MIPEKLILCVSEELRQYLSRGDEYSALKSSGLLRQLLLDSYPLVDQANKKFRIPIRYRVNSTVIDNMMRRCRSPVFACFIDLLCPKDSGGFPVETTPSELTRDQFLAVKPIFYDNVKSVTIKELIDHAAHILGGVHAGKAKNDSDRELNFVHDQFRIGNHAISLHILFPISKIVLAATEPLRQAITTQYGDNAHLLDS